MLKLHKIAKQEGTTSQLLTEHPVSFPGLQ